MINKKTIKIKRENNKVKKIIYIKNRIGNNIFFTYNKMLKKFKANKIYYK